MLLSASIVKRGAGYQWCVSGEYDVKEDVDLDFLDSGTAETEIGACVNLVAAIQRIIDGRLSNVGGGGV